MVVDDHPMTRLGVITCLTESEDCVVAGEADTPQQALELASSGQIDVALIDIRLGGSASGIDLARQLKTEYPEIKLVVFTNYPQEPYVRAMFEIGVDAYLLKDTPPSEIRETVRMVARGSSVFSNTITAGLVRGYLRAPYVKGNRSFEQLTSRESAVLSSVAEGKSNEDIANDIHLSVKGVQAHLTSLFGKLGVTNRTEAVVQAAKLGLVVIDEDPLPEATLH